ncbi:MAG TPA: hypothetical protein VJ949_05295, partial [Cryomorphaceae bacterium]|nr:hypothetical protein [Cryomorphaceae bacterium]
MKSFFSTTTIACLAFLLLCLPEGFSIADLEKNSPHANFNDEQGIILLGISIGEVSDPFMIINEGNDTSVDIEFTTSMDLPEGTTIEFEWELNGESGLTNWNGSLLSSESATHSVLDIPISNLEIGQVHNLLVKVISVNGELLTEAAELTSTILINPEEEHFALDLTALNARIV